MDSFSSILTLMIHSLGKNNATLKQQEWIPGSAYSREYSENYLKSEKFDGILHTVPGPLDQCCIHAHSCEV